MWEDTDRRGPGRRTRPKRSDDDLMTWSRNSADVIERLCHSNHGHELAPPTVSRLDWMDWTCGTPVGSFKPEARVPAEGAKGFANEPCQLIVLRFMGFFFSLSSSVPLVRQHGKTILGPRPRERGIAIFGHDIDILEGGKTGMSCRERTRRMKETVIDNAAWP